MLVFLLLTISSCLILTNSEAVISTTVSTDWFEPLDEDPLERDFHDFLSIAKFKGSS